MKDKIYAFRQELQTLGYCQTIISNYPKYASHFLVFFQETDAEIDDSHIKSYQKYLQQKTSKTSGEKLSESHIYSQLLGIKMYFEYLERIHKIKRNPFTLKLKNPRNEVREVLTQEQIKILYEHCKTGEEKMILHLCYGCGLRRSEAVNLNKKDIHIEKKLLFVRQGKGKKRRVIPLNKTLTADFKLFLGYQINTQEIAFLTNKQYKRMSGNTMHLIFKALLKKAKIKDISLHHLRHSIATHLLENDMSIEMVRDFLGHSRLSTTQIYTKINNLKMK
ncbi:tyrosine-type recombinase/integrase [Flavobacterium sp. Fl-318]|uniref:Tyrosine-type recombinase/integrase n=1 Tax=Flavobacterium cupriresistens TaxID=2893885 RepID=A0ABU4R5A6_9FLAO|nr:MULTISPECIES: tyrosine-type recombinase/integrase [unclassified Flavobacterium]MDX6187752.1 tyrosine-type recombinase/integrase [Flavobacterium sp. Fl-318]MDX6187758.1 tyrosine-type recombinase/integrase [Flavobacterium sp. Fl-318]UFH42319.1 tyrosine-type recombinase/integrase [Flavobacterium sp. F-323]UFH42326.1 tyrosine-type recombinase/integrase [Flavobacterium sp. F-323]